MEATRRLAADQGSPTTASAWGKHLWVAIVALSIVLLDQVTKLWVAASMRLHQSTPVVDGFFNLTYVRNTGAAFSMFADHAAGFRVPFFVVASLVAVVVILSFVRHSRRYDAHLARRFRRAVRDRRRRPVPRLPGWRTSGPCRIR